MNSLLTNKRLSEKIKRFTLKIFLAKKIIYQSFKYKISSEKNKKILFIVGCQRSGTTLLTEIFERDYRCKIYRECSNLSSMDKKEGLRLNPYPIVRSELDKNKASLIVLKPLVETQNILELLSYFDNSKALWVYRDYKDVVYSNILKFGKDNGIKDLSKIIHNENNDWRAEKVSETTKKIILRYFSNNMNPYDAAALFWFSRNIIFFELQFDRNARIKMCKYEDLVKNPSQVLKEVYDFIDFKYPGDSIIKMVHKNSLRKGSKINLSSEIDHICNSLLKKLDDIYHLKSQIH